VKQAAGFNKRVELYIARDPFPNAFAVSNAFRRAVVVNEGLLKLVDAGVLDKEDVKAILAHELGHIVHRDNTYAIAASMAPYMTYVVGFGAFLFGVTWIKLAFEEGDNPLPGIALSVFGGALLLLSFLVNVGVLGFLRMREHLADLFSVKVTRSTKIAEALVKMEAALEALGVERRRAVKPDARKMLYILPMAYGELFGFVSYLFLTRPLSSHPSTEARYYVVEKYYQQL
jgi:heat shock protein HtpX